MIRKAPSGARPEHATGGEDGVLFQQGASAVFALGLSAAAT